MSDSAEVPHPPEQFDAPLVRIIHNPLRKRGILLLVPR